MKFITKILASMGNIRAMEKLHVDDHTEAIINDIEQKPFGISENNVLYAGLNELGGYYFFQTVVVGQFHIKTLKGARLILKGDNIELQLNSDMSELESDYSNVSNRSITKIDFQIEEADIKTLQNSRITSIQLKAKKQDILFTKYEEK
ncbi:hypothetical protein DFQ05_0363 [Winogradskyella wandonensis]|uniref:Uncharacterized protein n=1 Tax=Winogradskyella wandonensis TaxID=1442586 RepID=A0A4R1KVX0_9FLAO|nr:hypothetical protein [Winogradskyella wandonensis]TCK68853.1 hypothetical protein DFQ05_0363 [Winogradskyella wandonensis]